jgi:hypothetical protein
MGILLIVSLPRECFCKCQTAFASIKVLQIFNKEWKKWSKYEWFSKRWI